MVRFCGGTSPDIDSEERIHKQVFSFGHALIIFIDKVSQLNIYNGLKFSESKDYRLLKIGDNSTANLFSFKKLYSGAAWDLVNPSKNLKKVDDFLLENLSETRNILIDQFRLSPSIVNSILGRLIFVKYLLDRDVKITKDDGVNDYFQGYDKISRNYEFLNVIKNYEHLYNFFDYLSNKLHGDLFPITNEERHAIKNEHLEVLYFLFSGAKAFTHKRFGYVIQQSLFDVYDFKIIPIELISSIYEQFIGAGKRQQNKSFYTPSFLVDYILSQTVSPRLSQASRPICKVLDPSCGSGIFLIETLRKIIEKYLEGKKFGKISNEKVDELWNLVEANIFGIDIDADAIEIAIFSLYVTVLDYIEPKIIESGFKFRKLKNKNFFPEADFFDTRHLLILYLAV